MHPPKNRRSLLRRPPFLAFFDTATSSIFEWSPLYSPLRTRTLLYLLFKLLAMDLPPMLYVSSPCISKFTNMPIVLFAELCLIYAENPFRMIKNVLNMLKKTPL